MKAIAAQRHHRIAPVLLLLLALVLTGVVYAALSSSPARAAAAGTDDVDAGRALFQANCASCHGMKAEGRDKVPSLVGVGSTISVTAPSAGRWQ